MGINLTAHTELRKSAGSYLQVENFIISVAMSRINRKFCLSNGAKSDLD